MHNKPICKHNLFKVKTANWSLRQGEGIDTEMKQKNKQLKIFALLRGLENKHEYRYKRTVTYKTFENITENDWLEGS